MLPLAGLAVKVIPSILLISVPSTPPVKNEVWWEAINWAIKFLLTLSVALIDPNVSWPSIGVVVDAQVVAVTILNPLKVKLGISWEASMFPLFQYLPFLIVKVIVIEPVLHYLL